MKAVFPGKPQAKLQAFSTALWAGRRIVTYISQNDLIILGGPNDLIQTTQHGESDVLEAVAISEASGKIATCTSKIIFVYSPFGQDVGALKWSLQHTLTPNCQDSSLTSLSWGLPEELLVAGSSLSLFRTENIARETWSKELANPAKLVAFTPDASFIASTGQHDRLVKIWRRQFYGGEEEEETFDVSYLSHPATVTSLRWHRRPDQEHHSDTVLYTTCGDSKLRIWAATDHQALQALQLWTELDFNECIVPRNPLSPSVISQYYIFIIDGWEFETMVEDSMHRGFGAEREKYAREHLSNVAYRNPDVCVVMDDRGNMSAWGLERVGCKARQPNDIFNIVLAEELNISMPSQDNSPENYVCFCNFAGVKDGKLNVLANMFNGAIEWLSSSVDRFFDTSSSFQRFQIEAIWTGQSEPINRLMCSAKRNLVLSFGTHHEAVAWVQSTTDLNTVLSRHNTLKGPNGNSHSCLLFEDQYLALASQSTLEIWNFENPVASVTASHDFEPNLDLMCLLTLTGDTDGSGDEIVILMTRSGHCISWRVSLDCGKTKASIKPFTEFEVPSAYAGDTFLPIRSLDTSRFSKSILYSVSSSGSLHSWGIELDANSKTFAWKRRTVTATGIKKPALTTVGSHGKAAIVSSTGTNLTIWDLRLGHLELRETFQAHETIRAIDITSSSGDESLLAIAFSHKAMVYVQDRYNTELKSEAWRRVRTVDIAESTNVPISDCVWLANHDLLLAAGNQMFVFDNDAKVPETVFSSVEVSPKRNGTASLQSVTAALNSIPAIFDPIVLYQILLSGDLELLDHLLNKIRGTLKFWSSGDKLDSQLDIEALSYLHLFSDSDDVLEKDSTSTQEDTLAVFSQEAATALKNIFGNIDLPFISSDQQNKLVELAESFGAFESHRQSADDLAVRYLTHLRMLVQKSPAVSSQIAWRDITLASHSVSQDVMIDLTSRMYNGRMLWKDARQCGMFLWIGDMEALKVQFENIGRNEYTKTDERNPIDCSLYYLALRKKQVLTGLWRMATWNREQSATLRLLGNNFGDPRWKTAALKNAYALLGLRRFEYAAAFFLLADCPKDAVNVLVSQLGDFQLAIAVARVYEGDDGPVFKELLRDKILPQAAREGNRWLATLAFGLLKENDMALRALTDPLSDLIKMTEPPDLQAKHFSNNEPVLAHFYRFLRDKLQRDPRESVVASPKAEWDLVMRSALSYVRAGCHLLALDLVRNWEFKRQILPKKLNGASASSDGNTIKEPSSPTDEAPDANDKFWPTEKTETNAGKPERKKVTEEPSAASIFDNFDF